VAIVRRVGWNFTDEDQLQVELAGFPENPVEGRLIEQQADEKSLSTRLVGNGEAIEPGQPTQVKQSFDPYP